MNPAIISAQYSEDVSEISSHYHDCHQILYIKSGVVTVTVNSKQYTAKKGSIVLISRFEEHSITINSDEYCRYALRISPNSDIDAENEIKYLFSVLVNRPENFSHIINADSYKCEIENVLYKIAEEINKSGQFDSIMLNLLFYELLVYINRSAPSIYPAETEEYLDIIANIKNDFETGYRNSFSLDDLSQKYNISKYYLSHIFKKVTGCSVMDYLISCRIVNAKKMLIKTNLSISEIVEECGFSDCSNFSRTFKKQTNMTPRDFRINFKHK